MSSLKPLEIINFLADNEKFIERFCQSMRWAENEFRSGRCALEWYDHKSQV